MVELLWGCRRPLAGHIGCCRTTRLLPGKRDERGRVCPETIGEAEALGREKPQGLRRANLGTTAIPCPF